MALDPVWRVASAANAGSGAAVRGRRHVLPCGGAVVDRRKRCFTPQTFPLLPVGKKEVHTKVRINTFCTKTIKGNINSIYSYYITFKTKSINAFSLSSMNASPPVLELNTALVQHDKTVRCNFKIIVLLFAVMILCVSVLQQKMRIFYCIVCLLWQDMRFMLPLVKVCLMWAWLLIGYWLGMLQARFQVV